VPLHILHIQYWGFEPKDCIPTFPFISPWGVLAYEPCLSHAQNTKNRPTQNQLCCGLHLP
jgi:hypothetical protein